LTSLSYRYTGKISTGAEIATSLIQSGGSVLVYATGIPQKLTFDQQCNAFSVASSTAWFSEKARLSPEKRKT
jgi:hypothetical protein